MSLLRLDGHEELAPFLDASDEEALRRLGRTTLIRIPGTGAEGRARLVSCLLHGNEDSGLRAVLELLRSGVRLEFDLWVLIGNVEAATVDGLFGHRYLDGQEDFNRVWGSTDVVTPQRESAGTILGILRAVPLEAALDLHNTTGESPPHAIVPVGWREAEALAATCCELVLRWSLDAGTLMEALSPRCPSVAVECGIAGVSSGREFAAGVLRRFLDAQLTDPRRPERLYETAERVEVLDGIRFAFREELDAELDLALRPDLDAHNFGLLPAGTRMGRVRGTRMPLRAVDMAGADVTDGLFNIDGDGDLLLIRDVTPVMITRAVTQTQRDCYFYAAVRI